jgi:hypothetical protein
MICGESPSTALGCGAFVREQVYSLESFDNVRCP